MLELTPAESPRASIVAMLVALALHIAFIALASSLRRASPASMPAPPTQLFELEAPPILRPEPEAEPVASPRPSPERFAARAARASRSAPARAPSPPIAGPSPDAQEVLDFGTTLVATTSPSSHGVPDGGGGQAHAALGTIAASAARRAADGTGAGDLSRAPGLSGGAEWRCPFPLEADAAGVDRARVTLRVDVARDGAVLSARALDDPGHGFARNARACALRKRLAPALDRAGQPMRADTIIHVTFER